MEGSSSAKSAVPQLPREIEVVGTPDGARVDSGVALMFAAATLLLYVAYGFALYYTISLAL